MRDTKRYGNNLSYTRKVTRNPNILRVTRKISLLFYFFQWNKYWTNSKPKSSEKQQLTLKPTVSEMGVSKPKSSEKQQSTWSKCCNQFAAHNNLQGTCLVVQVDSALHPFGGAKSSTGFGWGKLGNVTSAGWQVTLCDPIWHTSSRSSEAKLLLTAIFRYHFTLLYIPVPQCFNAVGWVSGRASGL